MMVYIIGTVLSVLFAHMAANIKKSRQYAPFVKLILSRLFIFLSLFVLTLIMAVRYNVGTDLPTYMRIYKLGDKRMEEGFQCFNRMLHMISDDAQVFVIFSSILICGGYFIAIFRESLVPAYSILLFVIIKDYFISMNCIRQYMATAIALFAIPYIKERDWKRAFLIILLAFTFHRSVIIFFLLFFLFQIDITPFVSGIIMAVTFLLSSVIVRMAYPVMEKFGFYVKFFENTYKNSTRDLNWAYILIFLSFFCFLSCMYKKVKKNKNLKLLYTATIISLVMLFLGQSLPLNAHRMTWHMNSLFVLYIPEATKMLNYKTTRWLVNVGIIGLYTVITISALLGGNQEVLPYQTFWHHL